MVYIYIHICAQWILQMASKAAGCHSILTKPRSSIYWFHFDVQIGVDVHPILLVVDAIRIIHVCALNQLTQIDIHNSYPMKTITSSIENVSKSDLYPMKTYEFCTPPPFPHLVPMLPHWRTWTSRTSAARWPGWSPETRRRSRATWPTWRKRVRTGGASDVGGGAVPMTSGGLFEGFVDVVVVCWAIFLGGVFWRERWSIKRNVVRILLMEFNGDVWLVHTVFHFNSGA